MIALPPGITSGEKIGTRACSRVFHAGHTFRLAKDDHYIAVLRGHCVEQRRTLIITDNHTTPPLQGPQPIIATVPLPPGLHWTDTTTLLRIAQRWAAAHLATPQTADTPEHPGRPT